MTTPIPRAGGNDMSEKTMSEKSAMKIQIPDLWQISQLDELKGYTLGKRPAGELIKETWHLCHDMRQRMGYMEEERGWMVAAMKTAAGALTCIVHPRKPDADCDCYACEARRTVESAIKKAEGK